MVPPKRLIGLHEPVIVKGPEARKEVLARIDTGAERSSIDKKLADDLRLGPVLKYKNIKNISGVKLRPYIKARIELARRKFNFIFSVADRSQMRYKVLIGQNILKRGFIIDPLLHHKPTRIKSK